MGIKSRWNYTQHFGSSSTIPGIVLSKHLRGISSFDPHRGTKQWIPVQGRDYHYSYCTDEETEAPKV